MYDLIPDKYHICSYQSLLHFIYTFLLKFGGGGVYHFLGVVQGFFSSAASGCTPNVIWRGIFLRSEQSSCCLVGRKINDLTLGSCKFVYSLIVERQSIRKQKAVHLLGPTYLGFINYCGLIEKQFSVFLIIQYILKDIFFLLGLVTNSSFFSFHEFCNECQIYKQNANIDIHMYFLGLFLLKKHN